MIAGQRLPASGAASRNAALRQRHRPPRHNSGTAAARQHDCSPPLRLSVAMGAFGTSPAAAGTQPSLEQRDAAPPPTAAAAPGDAEASLQPVPATLAEANRLFVSHPSASVPAAGILLLAAARLASSQPLGLADGAVVAGVVSFWLVQEWFVHKVLLHSSWEWAGKDIHKSHHEQPFHHVSLDPPALVLGVMGLAAGVLGALLSPFSPLWLTATAAYWTAGLLYEWLHYIVHTRWVPPPGWLRDVRRHHMLHHMRNEDYWLSFSLPAVDALFGTLPSRTSAVPLTEMARTAHGAAAAAAAAAPSPAQHDSSSSGSSQAQGSSSRPVGAAATVDAVRRSEAAAVEAVAAPARR